MMPWEESSREFERDRQRDEAAERVVEAVRTLRADFAEMGQRAIATREAIVAFGPVLREMLRRIEGRPPENYNPLPRFGLRASPS